MTFGDRPGPQLLDPALLRVIRASAGRLGQREDEFIWQVAGDLAALMPSLARIRGADGLTFCERVGRTVLWAAATDQPDYVAADRLRQLGARNWLDGFPEEQYVSVAHAVVRAVRDLSGDDWSTAMGSAWIGYLMWVKEHLQTGARQAAAAHAAGREAAPRSVAGGR